MTAAQLLIVEDDPALLHVLEATLEYGGFHSESVSNAFEALARINSTRYDTILLDLGLPDLDGAQLIRAIRDTSDTPIVVVSGRGSEQDKVSALDSGADDYVAKPFLPGELLARIRAVMRRRRPSGEKVLVGTTDRRRSSASARTAPLGPLEDKLYTYLKSRAGQTVSSDEIIDVVWDKNRNRGENHLRVLIANLRRKLKARGEPVQISNEWGRGYRFLNGGSS